jgi:hypothetical protein
VALRVVAGAAAMMTPRTNGTRSGSPIRVARRGTEHTMALPTLTVAQREEALRKAQAVIRS